MRKMPCLFVRNFYGRTIAGITEQQAPGTDWVLYGEGIATIKWDGTACLVRAGKLLKRYDAKNGKKPPDGFEPAQEPDPVTGHWPGWIPIAPADRWHNEVAARGLPGDGTYELIGPRVMSGDRPPYALRFHHLVRHGAHVVDCPRDFAGIKEYLRRLPHEGIVFHHPDGRMAKIRRDDFSFAWPPTFDEQPENAP